MRVLLFHLDGRPPNLALMRTGSHYRALGDHVELRRTGNPERGLFDVEPDLVYGSAIFTKTAPVVARLRQQFPGAIIGGTGNPMPFVRSRELVAKPMRPNTSAASAGSARGHARGLRSPDRHFSRRPAGPI